MSLPSVSIIIPVHNDAVTLAACVRAVISLTDYPDWNVVVVDDGSTDDGIKTLRRLHPQLMVVSLKERQGVAHALNTGFRHPLAAGRDIVRLHADVVIETPDWLRLLVEPIGADIGVVGARLVYPDGRIQSEGRNIVSGLGHHPRLANLRGFLADGPAGKPTEVDAVAGGLAYYRRAAIDAVGGLDERYGPVWMEDDDFCIAARHHGYRVLVQPAVKAVHYTRCAGPTFEAKVIGSEKPLAQITHQMKETASQIQASVWEEKWGWHPHFPDTNEIRRLHGQSRITWKMGETLRYTPAEAFPPVDCALVTWNSLSLLKRTLETLAETDYPADRLRVYVADNGSSDGTPDYLRELVPTYPFPLQIVTLPLNAGVAAGINAAILAGTADLVARLDDDIALPPEWLKTFVEDLRNRPFAGCVATKTINDTPARTLQWACPHSFPSGYNYRDEPDVGQADYLARVAVIHGCCILYRRDTFNRCGLFDIRYSPTQYDDIDHNIALIQAGYEVLYDGRTHVVHKISTGLDRSFPGMASASANGKKMYGKWGRDILERIDSSITLSREGRYLPNDGDTSAWLENAPSSTEFPRTAEPLSAAHRHILDNVYVTLAAPGGTDGSLVALGQSYLKRVRQLIAKGFFMEALDAALTTVNFLPTEPEIYVELSATYHRLGYLAQAQAAARRGLHLVPDHPALTALAQRPAADPVPKPLRHPPAPKRPGDAGPLRVLMVNGFQPRQPDDDVELMHLLARALQSHDIDVSFAHTARPDPTGFDLVHLWNTSFPYQTLSQLNALRVAAPSLPVCLSSLYTDLRESSWITSALKDLSQGTTDAASVDQLLRSIARGINPQNGDSRPTPRSTHLFRPPFEIGQRKIMELVDHVLPVSTAEWTDLQREFKVARPHTVLPLPVIASSLQTATPDWFHANFAARDFVLTVGGLSPQKNQLLLIHALRNTGIPLVIIGHHRNSDYVEICQRHAANDTIFIEHLEPEQLASAYRAARVYAAPAFQDCRFAPAIEAAIAGCSLVVPQRPAEQEYFGSAAHLCNPADISSIRTAVITAHRSHPMTRDRRRALGLHLAQTCDVSAVSLKLNAAYRLMLEARTQPVAKLTVVS